MTLYRATSEGNVPMTDEEEAEFLYESEQNKNKKKPIKSITMRQARVMLSRSGLLQQVDSLMTNADEETRITWEFAIDVQRDNPYIKIIGGMLNLTDEQIDNLFIEASKL